MISIIVPIYNAEKYLDACVESLLGQQTDEVLQIILVDDGSTDSSLSIAKKFAKQDLRVEVYSRPHAGQSAARNYGLQQARGEFIAFVDADDTLLPDWCKQHLAAIDSVDYVQSGYLRPTGDKEPQQMKTYLPRHQYQFTSPCMRLYRREALQGMRFAEGMIYEDVLFSVDFWLTGATCRQIRYAGYLYAIHPESTTAYAHPEDQKRIFQALRSRLMGQKNTGKWIVLFTCLRLKLHYWRTYSFGKSM